MSTLCEANRITIAPTYESTARTAWRTDGRIVLLSGYRREIESASDPEAKRAEIEARLDAIASPFRTAEATGQDIIDPRDTRPLLCEFVEDAQSVLRTQLGPPPIPYLP